MKKLFLMSLNILILTLSILLRKAKIFFLLIIFIIALYKVSVLTYGQNIISEHSDTRTGEKEYYQAYEIQEWNYEINLLKRIPKSQIQGRWHKTIHRNVQHKSYLDERWQTNYVLSPNEYIEHVAVERDLVGQVAVLIKQKADSSTKYHFSYSNQLLTQVEIFANNKLTERRVLTWDIGIGGSRINHIDTLNENNFLNYADHYLYRTNELLIMRYFADDTIAHIKWLQFTPTYVRQKENIFYKNPFYFFEYKPDKKPPPHQKKGFNVQTFVQKSYDQWQDYSTERYFYYHSNGSIFKKLEISKDKNPMFFYYNNFKLIRQIEVFDKNFNSLAGAKVFDALFKKDILNENVVPHLPFKNYEATSYDEYNEAFVNKKNYTKGLLMKQVFYRNDEELFEMRYSYYENGFIRYNEFYEQGNLITRKMYPYIYNTKTNAQESTNATMLMQKNITTPFSSNFSRRTPSQLQAL